MTLDDLIARYKAERNLFSDEALISSLWIDAETLAAVRARTATLPHIALVRVAEVTGEDLHTVIAISNLALKDLSKHKQEFWTDYID